MLRTTDGLGNGPMYQARSRDLGRTWTRPMAFTPAGSMPRLLLLGNGTLVLASGRPGVDLRFSFDGLGKHWTTPRPLLPPKPSGKPGDTCGYTDLVALDKSTFLVVYSWFERPGADGLPHKAILVRRVSVNR
ncbi:MAG: sialidase family protein [Acidobacteria bacterium]|nr:sialidase family protein [Acidobacteriota bacterium]